MNRFALAIGFLAACLPAFSFAQTTGTGDYVFCSSSLTSPQFAFVGGTLSGTIFATVFNPSISTIAFVGQPNAAFIPAFASNGAPAMSVLFNTTFTTAGAQVFNARFYDPNHLSARPADCNLTVFVLPRPTSGPIIQCNFSSELLTTLDPPVLDLARSGLVNGTLTLVVNVSAKYPEASIAHSNAINITLCDTVVPLSTLLLNPAASPTWDVQRVDCTNVFTFQLNWASVTAFCGARQVPSSDPNFILMEGELVVSMLEVLPPVTPFGIFLNRTIISSLPYELRFPRQVNVSLAQPIVVRFVQPLINTSLISAAIVRQELRTAFANNSTNPIDPSLPFGLVRLETFVPCPFRLNDTASSFTITRVQDNTIVATMTPNPSLTTCSATVNNCTVCAQTWDINLYPTAASVCRLDGTYIANFEVGCQIGSSLCVPGSRVNVTMNLASEWFCPQLLDTVDLSAVMYTYRDPAFTQSASAFNTGDTVYGWIEAFSTKGTISRTVIDTLQTIQSAPGTPVLTLAQGGLVTPTGVQASFVKTDSTNALPRVTTYSFVLNPTLYPAAPGSPKAININSLLNVTFAGNPATAGVSARHLMRSVRLGPPALPQHVADDVIQAHKLSESAVMGMGHDDLSPQRLLTGASLQALSAVDTTMSGKTTMLSAASRVVMNSGNTVNTAGGNQQQQTAAPSSSSAAGLQAPTAQLLMALLAVVVLALCQ